MKKLSLLFLGVALSLNASAAWQITPYGYFSSKADVKALQTRLHTLFTVLMPRVSTLALVTREPHMILTEKQVLMNYNELSLKV